MYIKTLNKMVEFKENVVFRFKNNELSVITLSLANHGADNVFMYTNRVSEIVEQYTSNILPYMLNCNYTKCRSVTSFALYVCLSILNQIYRQKIC